MPRGPCQGYPIAADPLPEVIPHDRAPRRDHMSPFGGGRFLIAPMTCFANAVPGELGFDGSPLTFVPRPFKRTSKASSCKANAASAHLRLISSSARWLSR